MRNTCEIVDFMSLERYENVNSFTGIFQQLIYTFLGNVLHGKLLSGWFHSFNSLIKGALHWHLHGFCTPKNCRTVFWLGSSLTGTAPRTDPWLTLPRRKLSRLTLPRERRPRLDISPLRHFPDHNLLLYFCIFKINFLL